MEVENEQWHWFPLQHSHLMSIPNFHAGGKGVKIHPPRNQRTLMPSPPWCLGPVMRLLEFTYCSIFSARCFCSIYRDVSWFLDDPGIGTPNLWYHVISFISICQACWVLLAHAKILLGPKPPNVPAQPVWWPALLELKQPCGKSTHGHWNDDRGNKRIKLRRAWKTGMLCKEHAPHPSLIPDLRSHVTILPYSAIFPHWRLIIAITLSNHDVIVPDHPTIRPSASCCLQLG